MKKIFIYLILSIAVVSCYEDYLKDFDYSSVYFPFQIDVRTYVVGEGTKIEVGTVLGGVRSNTTDRNVNFMLDNTLITPAILTAMKASSFAYIKNATSTIGALLPLPASYYTLSNNNTMVIKSGQHSGTIVVKPDSSAFLADPATLTATYVLPFYITDADADTILTNKRQAIIGLKYENMLFGNYWHGGVTSVKDAGGNIINTITYYTTIPTIESKIWILKTIAPNKLVTNGYSDQTTSKNEMTLTLDGTNIAVSSSIGSTFTVFPDGTSNFNRAKLLQNRKIVLSYKYVNGNGNTCYAQDTLTFRNRVRDGVNEWQDENPLNY